jgi:blue copper oxidase
MLYNQGAIMTGITKLNRRNFLKSLGIGVLRTYAPQLFPISRFQKNSSQPLYRGGKRGMNIEISAVETEVQLLPGSLTHVWAYRGRMVESQSGSLEVGSSNFLGPTIRVAKGQRIRVHFTNQLPEPTVIHWHGLHLPEDMDGHPRYAIAPGETYTYEFEMMSRAGTYWYHAHPHELTAGQVYRGLAGLFIVSDNEEAALGLPHGDYDVPLVLQDRIFDENNQLVYLSEAMMSETMGFLGDRILVNGTIDFTLPVETRAYRFRLVNGSNFRIYKLAWSDGTPLTVIATDGGLLETPVRRDYIILAPGERIELWADFSLYAIGAELTLNSLSFSGIELMDMGGMDMGGMDMATDSLPQGSEYSVMRIQVTVESNERLTLPERLSSIERHQLEQAVNADNPRRFALARQLPLWTINGRSFEMNDVTEDEVVRLNTTEVWEFDNLLEGDDQMAHPMHIHGVQFQVLDRQVAPETRDGWQTVQHGFVDEGWKDTILVMPGERVRLLIKFEDFTGTFVYHCHTLEHEDMGMMRNYRVDA